MHGQHYCGGKRPSLPRRTTHTRKRPLTSTEALRRIFEEQQRGRSYGGNLGNYLTDHGPDAKWFVDGACWQDHTIATSLALPDDAMDPTCVTLYGDEILLDIVMDMNDYSVPDYVLNGIVYQKDVRVVTPSGLHPAVCTHKGDMEGQWVGALAKDTLLPRSPLYNPANELRDAMLQVILDQYIVGAPLERSWARYDAARSDLLEKFHKRKPAPVYR